MPRRPNHYIRTARLSSGISQSELGRLLGVSADVVMNVESGRSIPSFTFVLGSSLLFGKSAERLFPFLYNSVQENLGQHAAELDNELSGRTDAISLKKLGLLSAMAKRTSPIAL
jgi:transcriptional regulator with XRE-family HTH domain